MGRTFAIGSASPNPETQDRAEVFEAGPALIVVVADGAGGTSHGGAAADRVVRAVADRVAAGGPFDDEWAWQEFLAEVDRSIARGPQPGQSTAVVLSALPGLICGASVGDSEAWLLDPFGRRWLDLTAHQRRKPLVGSGEAEPVAFRHEHEGGILLAGSDGLFKYAPAGSIRQAARLEEPARAVEALRDLVRLPNGRFQDDLSAVVCRLPG